MNSDAILSLISDLYGQLAAAQEKLKLLGAVPSEQVGSQFPPAAPDTTGMVS